MDLSASSSSSSNDPVQQFYHQIFRSFDIKNFGTIQGGQVFGFFLSSGLNKAALGDVWDEATQKKSGGLNVKKFINAMKLISLAQQGIAPKLTNIASNSPITIPKMQYPSHIKPPIITSCAPKPQKTTQQQSKPAKPDPFGGLIKDLGFADFGSGLNENDDNDASSTKPTEATCNTQRTATDTTKRISNDVLNKDNNNLCNNTVLSHNSTYGSSQFNINRNGCNENVTSCSMEGLIEPQPGAIGTFRNKDKRNKESPSTSKQDIFLALGSRSPSPEQGVQPSNLTLFAADYIQSQTINHEQHDDDKDKNENNDNNIHHNILDQRDKEIKQLMYEIVVGDLNNKEQKEEIEKLKEQIAIDKDIKKKQKWVIEQLKEAIDVEKNRSAMDIEQQKEEIKSLREQIAVYEVQNAERLIDIIDGDRIIKKQKDEIKRLKQQICTDDEKDIDDSCDTMKTAIKAFKEYFGSIPSEFMDAAHNKCYCSKCHKKRGDKLVYYFGNPAKKYVLPVGWSRLGLKIDDGKFKINNVWNNWHVAFHGTDIDSVKEVFKSGLQLLKPGDRTINGKELSMKSGHIKSEFKRYNHYSEQNELFDPNQIFLSPSIKYSSNTIYSKKYDVNNGDKVQFVFQLRVRPNSYKIGQETIGAKRKGNIIDDNYNNNELEWYTKENVGIAIHGLLVKVEKNITNYW